MRMIVRIAGLFSAAVMALSLAAVPGWTQDPLPPPVDSTGRIIVTTELVNVVFSVTDKRGRYQVGLGPDDFTVLEDGVAQQVKEFRSEKDLPLRIGLLIDTSNSIRTRFQFEQEAAIDFLHTVLRPKTDQAFVASFDLEPRIVQDLTDDPVDLAEAIRDLRAGGGTSLYDAIYSATKTRMAARSNENGDPFRKMLIVISDGNDSASYSTREQALEMARRNEVTIFTVSTTAPDIRYSNESMDLQNPCEVKSAEGDKVLKRFAQATGGASYCPFNTVDVGRSFKRIADELRSQYTITYKPKRASQSGEFREIMITTRRNNLAVHHRPGYYSRGAEEGATSQ